LEGFQGFRIESGATQGQILVLNVLHMPDSLDSGSPQPLAAARGVSLHVGFLFL
jgi:hypothetical protein